MGLFGLRTVPVLLLLSIAVVNIFKTNVYSEKITASSRRRQNLDNRKGTYRTLWTMSQRGAPMCIAECSKDVRCASVFYNKVTEQCQGHSVTYGNSSLTDEVSNFRYYVQPFGEKYIGDTCSVNSDCVTVNSECRQGLCACVPGYSFSPGGHQCKVCTEYGDDFMEIRDHYISKNNMEIRDSLTLEECFQSCISATNYTCRSLEYGRSSDICYLANVTVLDLPNRWYEDTALEFNISYYQRDCDF